MGSCKDRVTMMMAFNKAENYPFSRGKIRSELRLGRFDLHAEQGAGEGP